MVINTNKFSPPSLIPSGRFGIVVGEYIEKLPHTTNMISQRKIFLVVIMNIPDTEEPKLQKKK